jgi:hypothetical protein
MGEVVGMSVEGAIEYGSLLLSQSEAQWESYMGLYQQKQDLSKEISKNYYASDLETVTADFEAMTEEMNGKIAEKLAVLKDTGLDSGEMLGDGLITGLQSKEAEMIAAASRAAEAMIAEMNSKLGDALLNFEYVSATSTPRSLTPPREMSREEQTAQTINGIGTYVAGMSAPAPANGAAEVTINLDGQAMGRGLLPYNRGADGQSPTTVPGF